MSTYAEICKAECEGCAMGNRIRLILRGGPLRQVTVHVSSDTGKADANFPCTAPTRDQLIERLSADLTAAQAEVSRLTEKMERAIASVAHFTHRYNEDQERIRLLEGAIEGAPHEENCATEVCDGECGSTPCRMKCNCWKSRVLAPVQAEEKEKTTS